jgi:hypothetical protein
VAVTPFAQTIRDYAAKAPLSKVRLALAQADFEGGLDLPAIEAELRHGRHGAAKLRQALERHQPALARANSGLEIELFELCEDNDLPLPELNGRAMGWDVDALWREQRVAVELDGPGNHRSPAQIRRDRHKEWDLRAATFVVLRYSDEQIHDHSRAVVLELTQTLNRP